MEAPMRWRRLKSNHKISLELHIVREAAHLGPAVCLGVHRCHSVQPLRRAESGDKTIMAGGTWKIVVLMAMMFILAVLEFRTAEAQATGCGQCAANAYCYSTYTGRNYCVCRRGYTGDGYVGSGYSGCRRRKLRTWQVVISIIGSILGALLLLCLCLACLRNCLSRRRARGPVLQQGDTAYGYPQQTGYPQQGVPMAAYESNNQKVPGPAGVV